MTKFSVTFIYGFLFGIGNILPGISGGAIAIAMGFYNDLLDAINGLLSDFRKQMPFLVPFALGAVVGIIFFVIMLSSLIIAFSFPTSLFFAGLVFGCMPLILRFAFKDGVRYRQFLLTLLAFAAVVVMCNLRTGEVSEYITHISPQFVALLLIGGLFGAMAMLIPGVSGSFVLFIMGLYYPVINNLSTMKELISNPNMDTVIILLGTVIPIVIGMVAGVIIISRLLRYLLRKYYAATYSTILGFLFGSIYAIFQDPATYRSGVTVQLLVFGILAFAVGTAVTYALSYKEIKKN
jgi:putative membrane protein